MHQVTSIMLYKAVEKRKLAKKNPKTFIWKKGDVLILPFTQKHVVHTSFESFENKTLLFTSHDNPLFKFLKSSPVEKRFDPVQYKRDDIMNAYYVVINEYDCRKNNTKTS